MEKIKPKPSIRSIEFKPYPSKIDVAREYTFDLLTMTCVTTETFLREEQNKSQTKPKKTIKTITKQKEKKKQKQRERKTKRERVKEQDQKKQKQKQLQILQLNGLINKIYRDNNNQFLYKTLHSDPTSYLDLIYNRYKSYHFLNPKTVRGSRLVPNTNPNFKKIQQIVKELKNK
ncbi:hypothetical protein M0812_08186 [Anaeramoeba flamelloides]|uniref:Nucleolar protein 16 n=1 Tax=Anaeramoeba flamelloides TaxID=1746091 RepID=A0AAV7ZWJ1_9EUKA|nr:hypothetical protein M0812_08186 [Anaeramoeba flamelloides]